MGIGPFTSFAFPNVYTRTLNEAPTASAAGALRYPALVGVGEEITTVSNFEMIRGSSSIADNPIVREDVSDQLDGTNRNFTVKKTPIVTGNGSGTTTNSTNDVEVYVNNEAVPVASVNGATGEIYLVSIPRSTDTVQVSYYFKRRDEEVIGDDLSDQADGTNVTFYTNYVPIVQGNDGGITANDPSYIKSFTVDGSEVSISSVNGSVGTITLDSAPAAGSDVLVTYYTNEWQNTYDILPSPNVSEITRVGYSPGSSDFISGVDYALDISPMGENRIHWGHSLSVSSGAPVFGSDLFDDSQIEASLEDTSIFRKKAKGDSDGTNLEFILEYVPVSGEDRGFVTDSTSDISVWVGTNPTDASSVEVSYLRSNTDDPTKKPTIVLKEGYAPGDGTNVYVDQKIDKLTDDTWTLTNTNPGGDNDGTYSVVGATNGDALSVTLDSTTTSIGFLPSDIEYPEGAGEAKSDAAARPGQVEETVSLNFQDSTKYIVSSDNSVGTGTGGDNTGYINQTYMDKKTGFRVTLVEPAAGSYSGGDIVAYRVSKDFVVNSGVPKRGIPGVKMLVSSTLDVGSNATALIKTYNMNSDAEPNIGDFYYVTFDEEKADIFGEPQFFTLERNALDFTGPIAPANKLAVAAHLCFLNGAPAVSLNQIKKTTGGADAPDSAYIAGIDAYNEPLANGSRPSLLIPITASSQVLSYLKTSNTIQSGIRYANERMSYFGFALDTSPEAAQTFARSMNSERMIGIYPDGGVTTYTDELGQDVEFLVDGSLLAAAVAGRDTSPAFDVAEPLTKKPIVGFTRLFRRMDSVTKAQVANSGLTVLEEQAAGINVKIGLTTDLSSVLTRTPSVIRIKDFVQKGTRAILEPYIGTKFLNQRTQEIETTLGSYLNALRQAQIIVDYTGVKATPDPNDPTTVNVEAFYSPVLPLLWIVVTFNLRSRL